MSTDVAGRIVIGDEIDLQPSALLTPTQSREDRADQLARAVALLLELLDGRELPTLEVEDAAADENISIRTLARARAEIGVLHRRVAAQNTNGSVTQQTVLRLPGFEPPPVDAEASPSSPSREPEATPTPISPRSAMQGPSRTSHETVVPIDDAVARCALIEIELLGRAGRVDNAAGSNGHPTLRGHSANGETPVLLESVPRREVV